MEIVIDASGVLALLKMEEGYNVVADRLDRAIISTVNFSEVIAVVRRKGFKQEQVIQDLTEMFVSIEDFNTEQAIIAASLDEITQTYGLSFGDRACLSLAKYKKLPVLTADKIWKQIDMGVAIELIR